ncbi:nitrate reductase [Inhella gelatinilytica]|uniref:Molybdopterin-dependent oxidoreductase n=1 Tax=Inhella gelatinilytica TaxID=2795030 RepID=A0A931IYP6_9BURK|nr:nitrate reductase [Inhella gelatinilytica]MBH9552256.1 molybdopterin-dependent oxidoreductase [Inhella gelatinilytica]
MAPPTQTRSTCPYCGVGCGVLIEHDGAQITGVRGDPDHPANFGRLCTKGQTLHLTATPQVRAHSRLRVPVLQDRGGGPPKPVGWAAALDRVCGELLRIHGQHGPEAIGFYVSGQLLTEDYCAFNKLARGVLKTPHIDSNSRLCMSSAVVGYKQSLGADAPPCSYEDVEQAACLLIAGANPAWAHPVLFRRIEAARARQPGHRLIVVDPRRTETAELADLHLALQPGTDVALFHGLLHACIWQGWVDAGFVSHHTEGWAPLKDLVRDWTPARAAQTCGVPEAHIWQAAEWFAQSPRSLSLYCQGLNQSASGTANNTALINLHLATGQIGKPGAGPFSLTGQPNAMGGREAGGMATLLPGHRDPANPAHRVDVAKLWGLSGLERLPGPGHDAVSLFEAAARGEIKALWIVCTNPAQSLPDQALVRQALTRCELVIVQEAFGDTATAPFADVLLPASTWGEKEGTVTNSERRISRVRAAVPPPGEARADWAIAREVGLRLDAVLNPHRPSLFARTDSPEALWNEHRESTRGRDLDITGLSYALLDERGPKTWPFVQGPQARLYTDRWFPTPSGRARFQCVPFRPLAERADAQFPLQLTTTRLRDHWHGLSRSGRVPRLFGLEGAPFVRLHPQDAQRRRLAEGQLVQLRTRHGETVLPLRCDDRLGLSQADVAMHWGSEVLSGLGVNGLTQRRRCPDSGQPALKQAALSISPANLPWRVTACAWVSADEGPALHARLRASLGGWAYAHCVPVPSETDGEVGWAFEAAAATLPDDAWVARLALALGFDGPGGHQYADPSRGRLRRLRLRGEGANCQIAAFLRVGEGDEAAWLEPLWRARQPVAGLERWLLSPGQPPLHRLDTPRAPQVCQCFDVREDAIRACLARTDGRLSTLQHELRCGTQCGSCLPTLRRLIQEGVPA